MDEVKILIDFFRTHLSEEKKIRVLLTRIDDFNDANSSEEEKNQRVVASVEEAAEQTTQASEITDQNVKVREVNYMLFLKAPTVSGEKQAKKEKVEFMQQCSASDLKLRDHIHKLLYEAESLEQLKTTLMDPNSLSEIMSVIRQHTEKKKAFGQ